MHKKDMTIIILIVIAALFIGFGAGLMFTPTPSDEELINQYYTAAAVITEVYKDKDCAIAENSTRTFIIEDSADWEVGDCASFMLDSHGTDTVLDDTIVQIRYNNMDTKGEYKWIVNTSQQ